MIPVHPYAGIVVRNQHRPMQSGVGQSQGFKLALSLLEACLRQAPPFFTQSNRSAHLN